jgi:hypothetical protein
MNKNILENMTSRSCDAVYHHPKRCVRPFLVCVLVLACLSLEGPAWAGSVWFHATRRAVAKKILSKGLNPARFKSTARFGKGLYLARKPSTAVAETGKRNAVIRMRTSKGMKTRIIDLRNATKQRLRTLMGKKYDLRGKVKNRVIGPKLGHTLGTKAAGHGKAIQYRSVKGGGANLFVPKNLVRQKPRLVRPEQIYR